MPSGLQRGILAIFLGNSAPDITGIFGCRHRICLFSLLVYLSTSLTIALASFVYFFLFLSSSAYLPVLHLSPCLFCSVVDRHRFDSDPDQDPTFHFDVTLWKIEQIFFLPFFTAMSVYNVFLFSPVANVSIF
jgi:hypothetical protein